MCRFFRDDDCLVTHATLGASRLLYKNYTQLYTIRAYLFFP